MGSKKWAAAILFLFVLVFTGCKQEDDVTVIQPARHWVEKNVVVVAPLSDASTRTRLERTAQWFLENLESAQKYDTLAIRLKLEWHDELSEDLSALSTTLANRDDIIAIVGPFGNDAVATFAHACQQTEKPLIAPTATSEDIVRRYAVKSTSDITGGKPFLWSLTESDVALTETMMSAFATFCQYHGYEDALAYFFAPDNTYGQTFTYWAPFFAENYGIQLLQNEQYKSDEQLVAAMEQARQATHASDISERVGSFCVVENMEQLYRVSHRLRELVCKESTVYDDDPDAESNNLYWQLFNLDFFTYFALSNLCEENLAALGSGKARSLQGREGFSPYADPTTGFEQSYLQRYSVLPTFAECKLYDGLLLAAFAACYAEHFPPCDINEAIITITSADDSALGGAAWDATSMEVYLSTMEKGQLLDFKGAAGKIAFDRESYTSSTHTTFVQWKILEGQISHIGYLGDNGSQRLSNSLSAWKYLYDQNRALQDFEDQTGGAGSIQYEPLTAQYAVLVQGSEGFKNYRHQADVLSVYQLLRRGGFDDDHIILIIDEALANSSDNPEKGVIRAAMYAPDLLGGTDAAMGYPKAVVDYDAATLTPADISSILLGEQSDRLPTVLPRDAGQNVFFYWSGHGRTGEFSWRDAPDGQGFTGEKMRQTVAEMLNSAYCRKLFVVAEPCYSESVVRPLEGIQGMLAITGASGSEQSWADNWSTTALVWMSDRFSQNFVEHLTKNPSSNYRDLFLYCAEHTIGSHAKIINASKFGNLNNSGPNEFIVYNK